MNNPRTAVVVLLTALLVLALAAVGGIGQSEDRLRDVVSAESQGQSRATTTSLPSPESPATTTSVDSTAPPSTAPASTTSPITTQPLPSPEGDKWIVSLRGLTEGQPERPWWDASYFRALPFGLDTGWADGDREGYRCLYGFLTLDDQVVGRVTFARVDGASYAAVKDVYMAEGARYLDGTLASANAPKELGQCPEPTLKYEPYNGPDERPTITYSTPAGQLLEIRNYKNTVPAAGITFQQTEQSPNRVAVVAYEWGNPVIVVYYESLSPLVVMGSDM